jgi:phosphoribosylglycinamide formyltransferase-1
MGVAEDWKEARILSAHLHCRPSDQNTMQRIVTLVSGRGSNMQAIHAACVAQSWPARFVGVVSNRPQAGALAYAAQQGIESRVVDHQAFDSRSAFDEALAATVDAFAPDLVVLAGFMRILDAAFVHRYQGRMLNIHPSLLPAFTGLHTHRRALQAGCQVAGTTVHFVTPELDHGPIVMQAVVPVRPGDDEHSLAARVLAAEHMIYPLCVRWFVEGKLQIAEGRVRQRDGASQVLV